MRPGDILAIRGTSWVSKQILRLTGNTVSHVGMVIAISPEPLVTEALTHVVTRPLWESTADAEKAYILSDKSLTPQQRAALVNGAQQFSADGYNYLDIGFQALDSLAKTTWFTDHLSVGLPDDPICSYLVASAYKGIGLTFGKTEAQSVTPADIYAFALANPQLYDITEIK